MADRYELEHVIYENALPPPEDAITSIALSLKRIADALQKPDLKERIEVLERILSNHGIYDD